MSKYKLSAADLAFFTQAMSEVDREKLAGIKSIEGFFAPIFVTEKIRVALGTMEGLLESIADHDKPSARIFYINTNITPPRIDSRCCTLDPA